MLITALVTASLGAISTTDAAAGSQSISRTSWAYTDAQQPQQSFVNGTGRAPVGAWREAASNQVHKSKSYFTFDLPDLGGATLLSANLGAQEATVTDCTKPRRTEAWHTEQATTPTWAHAPRQLTMLQQAHATPGCVGSVTWDATAVVQAAYAGTRRLTVALQMSGEAQDDVRFGRTYSNRVTLQLSTNLPPSVPESLSVNYLSCRNEPLMITNREPWLEAVVHDPDLPFDQVDAHFALWPSDAPAERTEYTSDDITFTAGWRLPIDLLAHDREYTWTVRASDTVATTGWAPPCRFRTDFQRPRAPLVHSDTYPRDQVGALPGTPGEFVISPNADTDIVSFGWRAFDQTTIVAADGPGGTATITFTPASWGEYTLYFHAIDRSGQVSPVNEYTFFVRDPTPTVTCEPFADYLGEPRECTFVPNMDGVSLWQYSLNYGEVLSAPPGPAGTARVTVTPVQSLNVLHVVHRTVDGDRSPTAVAEIWMFTDPAIDCTGAAGEPLACTFRPTWMRDVVGYTYQVDGGTPVEVAADAEGVGHATVVLDGPGYHEVTAVATDIRGHTSTTGRWTTSIE